MLSTYRNYDFNGEDTVDQNKVTFKGWEEKKLMDNLPNVDHVINFAGPEFVEVFTAHKRRPRFR